MERKRSQNQTKQKNGVGIAIVQVLCIRNKIFWLINKFGIGYFLSGCANSSGVGTPT